MAANWKLRYPGSIDSLSLILNLYVPPNLQISKLLIVNPTKRLTATETLQHRFFETAEHDPPELDPKKKFKVIFDDYKLEN